MDLESKLVGTDLFGHPVRQKPKGPLAERFGAPPFTILDAKAGDWQERKKAWINLGIESEVGREEGVNFGGDDINRVGVQGALSEGTADDVRERFEGCGVGASVFDPVLCELVYRWWLPKHGQVIDPFAGGSVRGIVAGCLNRRYWGCDLREEQIAANRVQAEKIQPDKMPVWVAGDSMLTLDGDRDDAPFSADLIFSCPPYGNLETYSTLPGDLSNMRWPEFVQAYRLIIQRCAAKLNMNRFAVFVVGDFRDERGYYRGFVNATVQAFTDAGLHLYNDAILATPCGSAGMRAPMQFSSGRKLAKVHQNLLVFVKGDWKRAAAICAPL